MRLFQQVWDNKADKNFWELCQDGELKFMGWKPPSMEEVDRLEREGKLDR